ncbi:MAG: methyl-accepting chemotaxis protein [Clostridia bacterium]|nr:methyl-accepting chemotaxis protein [Clostridia bacterium]
MNLSIRTKLLTGFIVVLLLSALVGYFGLTTGAEINKQGDVIAQEWLPKTDYAARMNKNISDYRIFTSAYMLAALLKDEKNVQAYEKMIGEQLTKLEQNQSQLGAMLKSEEEQARLKAFQDTWIRHLAEGEKVTSLVKANKIAEAMVIMRGGSRDTYNQASANLQELIGYIDQQAKLAKQEADDIYNQGRNTILGIMGVAMFTGLGVAWLISRNITGAVNQLVDVAQKVSAGDLTTEVKVKATDEIGTLAQAISQMVADMRGLISKVSGSSQQVAATSQDLFAAADGTANAVQEVARAMESLAQGSTEQTNNLSEAATATGQLAQATDQIAKGAQEQAASVNQTAAMANQMASCVQEITETTEKLSGSAEKTTEATAHGSEAVEKTVQGMLRIKDTVMETAVRIRELGEQSQQIGEIIQVIDDIAEQTNLLALNAAIEAARAGDHGKGFAVVADEVRKLAERSGKATKEIATLIINIQHGTEKAVEAMNLGTKEVEEGALLTENAGKALADINHNLAQTNSYLEAIVKASDLINRSNKEVLRSVDNVASITEENTASTEEMAAGSRQINESISKINDISQQTAAAAEEVSASTEEMNASVQEIAVSAQTLAKMSQELQDAVAQFKV